MKLLKTTFQAHDSSGPECIQKPSHATNLRVMDRIPRDTTVFLFVVLLHCFISFFFLQHFTLLFLTSQVRVLTGKIETTVESLLMCVNNYCGFWFHSALLWKQVLKSQNLLSNRSFWGFGQPKFSPPSAWQTVLSLGCSWKRSIKISINVAG